jgi:hypothetical protein
MSELIHLIKYDHVPTNKRPAVTSFPNMQSVALDYHTTHHFTHTAAARLASYWTRPSRRYQLLAITHLNAAALNPTSPTVLELRWVFKLAAQCHTPSATKESTANKQHIEIVRLQYRSLHTTKQATEFINLRCKHRVFLSKECCIHVKHDSNKWKNLCHTL